MALDGQAGPARDIVLLNAGAQIFLKKGLQVMDATAISLCMDNKLPIIVFDLTRSGNIRKVVCGESIGTLVKGE